MALESESLSPGASGLSRAELRSLFQKELEAIVRGEKTEEECAQILTDRFDGFEFELDRCAVRGVLVVANAPGKPTPREFVEKTLMVAIGELSDASDLS